MSFAIAVRIAGSSVRSIAGRPRSAPVRGAEVGDGVHRVGRRAAVAEREQLAAALEARPQRRGGSRQRLAVLGQGLRAQRAALARLHHHRLGGRRRRPARARAPARRGTGRGSSTRRRRGRGGRRARRAARGARRTRARAPTAGGRASRPVPGGCAGPRVGGSNSYSPPAGENAIVRQPRARASASARAASPPSSLGAERDRDVVGQREQRDLRGELAARRPPRRWRAARAFRRSPDGRTRPPRGGRPSAPRASVRTRSGGRRGRSARPSGGIGGRAPRRVPRRTRRLPACGARAAPRGARPGSAASAACVMRRPRRARRSRSSHSRHASIPSPVRALTTIRSTSGWTWSMLSQERVEIEIQVRQQVDLVDQHELAGPEHQRVLQRLVLALGHRAHHHARILADAKLGRAHEVADVLDDQQVDLVERERRDRRADHVRVEMALAAESRVGVDLGHRHMQPGEAIGVHRPLHVALEHARRAHRAGSSRRARAASSCRRRARS